ncbi:Cysteine-rich receptor protein kinase 10 [Spatholobus suberectus]|nr:Cysteine-rich receptor protein kinase 10 [Spatholobus suberectus]
MEGALLNVRSTYSFVFVLILLSFKSLVTKAQPPFHVGDDCDHTTPKPLSSAYQANVNSILSWLSSDAATSKAKQEGARKSRNLIIVLSVLGLIALLSLSVYCLWCRNRVRKDDEKRKQLDWKLRLSIINGIARGLLYLHEDSRLKVIHRDLKASNVLLDDEMNPKISDFGLARAFERGQNQANTNRVMGTYGYMAPEYAMEGLFSMKSDVFSFGVLVLEIICGKKNSGFFLSEHGQSLLLYTWRIWCAGKCLELMDPVLENSYIANEVEKCIHIGLLCVQEVAADRPTMSTIVVWLASDITALPRPNKPAFSVGRRTTEETSTSKGSKSISINEVSVSSILPR